MTGRLTPRELEVVRLKAQGETYPAIAARLGITRSTVCRHLSSAVLKGDAGSYLGLLRELGWLTVPGGDARPASAA